MPQRISVGDKTSGADRAPLKKNSAGSQFTFLGKQVSPAVLITAVVCFILALILLVHNLMGPGQLSADDQRALIVVQQAANGDWGPLDQEDSRRKAHGEPPIQLPSWLHKPAGGAGGANASSPPQSE